MTDPRNLTKYNCWYQTETKNTHNGKLSHIHNLNQFLCLGGTHCRLVKGRHPYFSRHGNVSGYRMPFQTPNKIRYFTY